MNKILQLSLVSALVATNAFSYSFNPDGPISLGGDDFPTGGGLHTDPVFNSDPNEDQADLVPISNNAYLPEGVLISSGATQIVSQGATVQCGDNNGMENGVYDDTTSTAIDVMPGGYLKASATDTSDTANTTGGGTILGTVVRHHVPAWAETQSDSQNFYISGDTRGFISNALSIDGLQEMYDMSNLNSIYSLGSGNTFLLSQSVHSELGLGELALATDSAKIFSPNSVFSNNVLTDQIVPGVTFVIPAQSSSSTIAANLSNKTDSTAFSGITTNYPDIVASTGLQILPNEGGDPENPVTLTFTGDNSDFEGTIEIGNDSSFNGTVIFGESSTTDNSVAGSTTKALGCYSSMTVNDLRTVSLAGGDPVTIDKTWTFYGNAKLQASKRITLASGANMIFGATKSQDEPNPSGGSGSGGSVVNPGL